VYKSGRTLTTNTHLEMLFRDPKSTHTTCCPHKQPALNRHEPTAPTAKIIRLAKELKHLAGYPACTEKCGGGGWLCFVVWFFWGRGGLGDLGFVFLFFLCFGVVVFFLLSASGIPGYFARP